MQPLNVFFIITRLAGCVISTSCVVLVLFQRRQDRKSWFFAALAGSIVAEAFCGLAFHFFIAVAPVTYYQVETVIFTASSYFTIILVISAYLFCIEYLNAWTPLRRKWAYLLLTLPVPSLFLTPTTIVPHSLVINPNGTIDYVLSTWTIPFFGIGMVSSFLAFQALYQAYRRTGSATPFLGWLFAGVLLMMSGTFFPWVPVFKQYTVEQLSYSLGCVLLIRPVLQQNLFNPLVELHRLAEEKAKALSEASEAKTEFLSMMSHDLRTPLQSITMLSQFMAQPDNYPGTTLSPSYQDDVTKLVQFAQQMKQLVDGILDFAKIEAGQLELNCSAVDPRPILNGIYDQAMKLIHPGVEYIPHYDVDLPLIWADDVRLRDILLNLVSNACKFCEAGSITVQVNMQDKALLFSVADTGPGIPTELRPTLFSPFKQARHNARRHGGTGLGLSISKQLIELHGGTIDYESHLGVGTTFTFTVPLASEAQIALPMKDRAPAWFYFGTSNAKPPLQVLLVKPADYSIPPVLSSPRCEFVSVDAAQAVETAATLEPLLTIVLGAELFPNLALQLQQTLPDECLVIAHPSHEPLNALRDRLANQLKGNGIMTDHILPPGPTNSRQNLLHMSRDPLAFFLNLMHTYGEVTYVRVGTRDTYVISDPSLLQRVYIEDVEKYDKDDHTKMTFEPAGQGLIVLSGSLHKQHRRTLQPLFTPQRVVEYANTVIAHTKQMLDAWRAGQVRDVEADFAELTMGIVCEAIFGIRSDHLRAEFTAAMIAFQQHTAETRYRSHFSDEHKAAYQAAIATFDRVVRDVLAHMEPNGRDFLTLMVTATDPESGKTMSTQEIRDEALTLLIAGHETTANALLWMSYLLGKYPAVAERLAAEIQRVVGQRTVTPADLPKLELLNMVFKEALRLYPPVWLMGRRVTEPIELGGYQLPQDAVIAVSPYAIHRNPKYFPEPGAFKPERWLIEPAKYAYLPFGLGPHVCLGQHFATMEAQLVLVTIAQRFRFSVTPDFEAVPEGMGTLKPRSKIQLTLMDWGSVPVS